MKFPSRYNYFPSQAYYSCQDDHVFRKEFTKAKSSTQNRAVKRPGTAQNNVKTGIINHLMPDKVFHFRYQLNIIFLWDCYERTTKKSARLSKRSLHQEMKLVVIKRKYCNIQIQMVAAAKMQGAMLLRSFRNYLGKYGGKMKSSWLRQLSIQFLF